MVLGVFALGVVMYGLTRPDRAPSRLWKPALVPAAQPTTEGGHIPRVPTFQPPPDEYVTVTEEVGPLPMNKRVPVMCTVSNTFGPSDILPADGVCDAIFYDSLYRDGRNTLNRAHDASLERFLDLGQSMQLTGVGVSFDVHMDVRKVDVTSANVTSGILKLWNRGVSHFGALRVYTTASVEDEVIAFLSFLQAVENKILGRMNTSRPYYTVVGVSYHREASYENVIRHMKYVYKPFLYVIVIHVPYADWELQGCLILPPTLLETPVGATQFNQSNVMEAMRYIQRVHSHDVHVPMAISFTLRARFYKPADLSGNGLAFYKPFRKCQDHGGDRDVSPASVCKDRYVSNFNYFGDRESAFTFDAQRERTVTYDTQITIKTKLCKAKQAYPDVPFGIAAFDVNLDIAKSACNDLQIEAGSFTRLRVLSKMDDYISGSVSTFQECMNAA
ncbi:uncharacterized protein LOC119373827 [Rhipicephalus sanguineus]|uniref:uncharacterized protein LOC119373827 n=1 Tax=Rhipicephalus sanguineus TaxID=34632 RepID=UPI0018941DCB|nr:uncharacterized protein LOC119373827 [Rhipicephalus sanguineus]